MYSFPKIFQLGTRYVQDIFEEEVEITEKIDGSQFRFCLNDLGEVDMWGRNAQIFAGNADKNFVPVVEWVQSIKEKLMHGCVYYGETLARPRHNVLKYDRTPNNNFCLFGASFKGNTLFSGHEALVSTAAYLGCDAAPLIYSGIVEGIKGKDQNAFIDLLLDRESYLGGCKIEGVVIKNLNRSAIITGTKESPGVITPIMCAKFVSESFKEKHEANVGEYKQSSGDRIAILFNQYRTEARWNKAVQHLKESGNLDNDPKDIGKLMKEVNDDIVNECKEEIMENMWQILNKVHKGAWVRGLPEWYKRKLLEEAE